MTVLNANQITTKIIICAFLSVKSGIISMVLKHVKNVVQFVKNAKYPVLNVLLVMKGNFGTIIIVI